MKISCSQSKQSSLITLLFMVLVFTLFFQPAYAEISDEDAATILKAYNEKIAAKQAAANKELSDSIQSTWEQEQAAEKASISSEAINSYHTPSNRGGLESTKTKEGASQVQNSRGGLESSKNTVSDISRRRGAESPSINEDPHSSDSVRNISPNTADSSQVEEDTRVTGGFFSRIFGKGGFFSRIFGGLFSGGSRSNTTEPREFPTTKRDRGNSRAVTQGPTDLVPETTQVNIGEEYIVFLGQIKIIDIGNDGNTPKRKISKTCTDNGQTYDEGTSLHSLVNSDGTTQIIVDASFVCRKGKWEIEGSLPRRSEPSNELQGRMSGTNTSNIDGTPSNIRKRYADGPSQDRKTKTNSPSETARNVALTNKIFVDYDCDGAINIEKEFTTPFKALTSGYSRIIPLSVRTGNSPDGNHCFAFKVDTTNVVLETNEDNNQSDWKIFTVNSNIIPTETSVTCPQYQQPICGSNEVTISGTVGSDGCQTAPSCVTVSSGDAGPDDIMFEVKSYVLSDPAAGGTTARITVKEWSSEDITLGKYQKLAFRWSAYNYDSCLASIYPEKYVFDSNTTSITGNTENSGIAIKGLSRVYSVECTTGDVTYKKEINVQAQY